ncbi:alpha/beta hydrolase [Streptomyces sp. NPDC004533]|uniref:alpha/beta fold hydrolase n=1 Tax=Streptomyces sp. NPDC004533 TaxID=3154278 RepID=UPI0033B528DC
MRRAWSCSSTAISTTQRCGQSCSSVSTAPTGNSRPSTCTSPTWNARNRARCWRATATRFCRWSASGKHGSARPLVIVGHSMGGQIAELAALREHGLSGLVLITPAPLGGYPMPAEQMEVFRQRARDKDRVAISRGKVALSFNIGVRGLKTLVNATASTPVETSLQQLEAWTVGHPLGAHPSQVKAPTLVVTSDDTFFTTEFLTGHVAPRFTDAGIARVPEAGHWPHVEQPARLAEVLTEFLAHIS